MVLIHPHTMQLGRRQLRRETLPNGDGQIFSCWNASGKFGHFSVQESMIHGVEHFAIHSFFELLQINYKTGSRIDLSLHRDFEDVIVSVSVGVVAFPEQAPVLLRRKLRIVVVVRSGEFSFAGQVEHKTTFYRVIAGLTKTALSPQRSPA